MSETPRLISASICLSALRGDEDWCSVYDKMVDSGWHWRLVRQCAFEKGDQATGGQAEGVGKSRQYFGLGATAERPPLSRALPGRSRSLAMSKRKTFREEHG